MASPDTIILLIVDYHTAIGEQDPVPLPPCVRSFATYRAAVDGVDVLNVVHVQSPGKALEHTVQVTGVALGQKLAADVARSRSSADDEDHLVPRRTRRRRRRLALDPLAYTTPPYSIGIMRWLQLRFEWESNCDRTAIERQSYQSQINSYKFHRQRQFF